MLSCLHYDWIVNMFTAQSLCCLIQQVNNAVQVEVKVLPKSKLTIHSIIANIMPKKKNLCNKTFKVAKYIQVWSDLWKMKKKQNKTKQISFYYV